MNDMMLYYFLDMDLFPRTSCLKKTRLPGKVALQKILLIIANVPNYFIVKDTSVLKTRILC